MISEASEDVSTGFLWREALLIVVALACIGVLVWQNLDLRRTVAVEERNSRFFESSYYFNVDLAQFAGRIFPADVLSPNWQPPENDRTLIAVMAPTMCNRCLMEGHHALTDRQTELASANVDVRIILIRDVRDDEVSALALREAGLLVHPFTFVDSETAMAHLPLTVDGVFTDAPLYFLTDRDNLVMTAFKPDQMRPETLTRWLEAIL
ncbi:MAG: hypothetical protein AAGD38_05990 [Acidobacteriota bacterium]